MCSPTIKKQAFHQNNFMQVIYAQEIIQACQDKYDFEKI